MVIGLIFLSSIHAFAEGEEVAAEAATGGGPPTGPTGYNTADVTKPADNIAAPAAVGVLTLADLDVQTYVKAEAEALKKNTNDYAENQEACKSREDKANYFCMESRNPDVKKYLIISQVLMAGVSGMADACGKFGQVMDAGNKALTAYQALCSSWRGMCLSSCGGAVQNIQDAQKNLDILVKKATAYANNKIATLRAANPGDPKIPGYESVIKNYQTQKEKLEPSLQKELEKKGDYMSVADKKTTCDGYAKELASSALGMLSMAKSFGQANNCNKNTTNAPNPVAAGATPVDCTIATNKQNNMTCICQDSPRTPGCNTGLDSALSAKNADSMRSAGVSDYVPGKSSAKAGVDGGSGETTLASKLDGGGGGSLPGAPSGGSAGIDGGNGGGGGPPGSQGAAKSSGLNTNILAGEGGGGGGGGWGGYGSDGEGKSLRQYLPGGAKDPTALAGQSVVNKEVTSQGGKSNWEKVRERYRDNKPKLLGY